jgi:hypothetical protein
VNLNFTGFYKILKKHDRHLPNPCKTFYTARLHDQSWVRGDYSDVMVTMSRVYSLIRGDEEVKEKETEKQVRTILIYLLQTKVYVHYFVFGFNLWIALYLLGLFQIQNRFKDAPLVYFYFLFISLFRRYLIFTTYLHICF